GAALAGVAADMGAGEPEPVAQELDQERAPLDLARRLAAVHCHGYRWHPNPLLPRPGRRPPGGARPFVADSREPSEARADPAGLGPSRRAFWNWSCSKVSRRIDRRSRGRISSPRAVAAAVLPATAAAASGNGGGGMRQRRRRRRQPRRRATATAVPPAGLCAGSDPLDED